MRRFFKSLVILSAQVLIGCGGQLQDSGKVLSYEEAQKEYLQGIDELAAGNFEDAVQIFTHLSRGQRYIKYTPLAKLRLGDTYYFQDRFDEAITAYQNFIDTSESDPNLHYAYFKIGDCRFQKIPGEFFLIPPPEQKDQRLMQSALKAIDNFLEKFPNSPHAIEASKMRDSALNLVFKHELSVISFYESREKGAAVALRIEGLFETYKESYAIEELHVKLAKSYISAGEVAKTIKICQNYKDLFPAGKYSGEIAEILKFAALTQKENEK
ncbi:MAG: outer membrane protein assembly factor BamD [Deltaproteobacteria bacterium]|nr:outer membrane protein assembly factor BamD [Deltaproteobacteria bacterium]